MSTNRWTRGVVAVAVMVTWPSLAAAQLSSPPSSSPDVSIAVGQKVSVTTTDGRMIKGRVLRLSPTTLDIGEGEVVARSLAMADVRRVQVGDSVKNGVIVGGLSFGLVGLLAGSMADAGNAVGGVFGNGFVVLLGGEPQPVPQTHNYLTGAVVGVAVGALLGYAMDAGKEKTIYERATPGKSVAVRPIVSAAGKGVGVSVRW